MKGVNMSITESRIKAIENRLDELTANFLQIQKNQVPITEKVDTTSIKVEEITPYTETKTGFYKETEKTFYNVPDGNVSVFFDGYDGAYSVKRIEDRLIVSFDELDQKTNITISIM